MSTRQYANPDDAVGVLKEATGDCRVLKSRALDDGGSKMPDNGEYEAGIYKRCGPFGAGFIGGYKRIGYNADPASCCLSGSKSTGTMTCSPIYWDGAKAQGCSLYFNNYCKDQNRIFDNVPCQQWADYNPNLAKTIKYDVCSKYPFSNDCIEWSEADGNDSHKAIVGSYCNAGRLGSDPMCRTFCQMYPGSCNNAAISYCKTANADADFCSCINFPLKKYNAECIDNKCAQLGYKTTMSRPTCNITSCDVYYDLKDIGSSVEFVDNTTEIRCGGSESAIEPKASPLPLYIISSIALIAFLLMVFRRK